MQISTHQQQGAWDATQYMTEINGGSVGLDAAYDVWLRCAVDSPIPDYWDGWRDVCNNNVEAVQ